MNNNKQVETKAHLHVPFVAVYPPAQKMSAQRKKAKKTDSPSDPFTLPEYATTAEEILGKKLQDGNPLYKVKWSGHPESYATWQARFTIEDKHAQHLMDVYDKAHPNAAEEGQWEVECILRKRSSKGQPRYLTKWKGWAHSSNEWLPRECFADDFLVDSFEISEAVKEFRYKITKKLQNNDFDESFYLPADSGSEIVIDRPLAHPPGHAQQMVVEIGD